jgi:uncharacterized protein
MAESTRVLDLNPKPGERLTTLTAVQIGDTAVTWPVIVVRGQEDGPRVAITAGIHGAEYVGIEATRRIGMLTDPATLHGTLVVVPISNPVAFQRRSIYTTGLDNNNINRVFPGNPSGQPAEVMADWLFRTIIEPSDYYIDMHGGDMIEALVPFVGYQASGDATVRDKAYQMAVASGIARIMGSVGQGGLTYAAAAAVGIPAVLIEVGGQGVWTEEEVEYHRESVYRVLRELGVLEGPKPDVNPDQRAYDTFAWLRSEHDGLFHPTVKVGEYVREGQRLGHVTDYFGTVLETADAPVGGEIVFLVTSLAMNAGDPLLAVGA